MVTKNTIYAGALALLAASGCVAPDQDPALEANDASLIGGSLAAPGQFPATVALLTPLDHVDTRYCMTEDRRCTMTRIGAHTFLAAAHCFADKNELEQNRRVVLSPLFATGAPIGLSHGVDIWEYVEGTCPEQTFGGQIAVPAPDSERRSATVRRVHMHPSYATGGAEAGQPGEAWPLFTHADVAILEVEEDLTGFASEAKVSFDQLRAGSAVVIGGHGMSGGFTGSTFSSLKFASRSVDALVGQDFFTRMSDPFGGPGIAPGDSGGGVFLASDRTMRTVVGVNSKSMAYRGSAHVRLDDGGPQEIRSWFERVMAETER